MLLVQESNKGWIYTKALEKFKLDKLIENYKAKIRIIETIIKELSWWIKTLAKASATFKLPIPAKVIYSDASDLGWGVTDGKNSIYGIWTKEQIKMHINYKELLAVKFGFKILAKNCENCHILLRIDNTTAISYINKMGGVRLSLTFY